MKQTLIIAFTVLGIVFPGYAQLDLPPVPDMRTCATMEQDSINKLKYPDAFFLDDFEYRIQQKVEEIRNRYSSGRIEEPIFTIPVIFHIVHKGEPVGSGTNLPAEMIQAQLEVLNEDFQRLAGTPGFNDNPVGADIQIEFCLASIDPDGQQMAEPGIDRVEGTRADWTRTQIEGELKPATYWNSNFYYNIWTVDFATEDELLLG